MTHEELLETIDFLPLDGLHAWMQPALRAVVELHPYETHQIEDKFYEFCNHCQTAWPCQTIQVIEKELA